MFGNALGSLAADGCNVCASGLPQNEFHERSQKKFGRSFWRKIRRIRSENEENDRCCTNTLETSNRRRPSLCSRLIENEG